MDNEGYSRVLLLKANHYKFEDDKKKTIEGKNCIYIRLRDAKSQYKADESGETQGTYGKDAAKANLTENAWELIKKHGVMAWYDFLTEYGVDSNTRKEVVIVEDVRFVGYLSPEALKDPYKKQGA